MASCSEKFESFFYISIQHAKKAVRPKNATVKNIYNNLDRPANLKTL